MRFTLINNNLLEQGCTKFKLNYSINNNENHYLSEFVSIITGKENTEIASKIGKYPFFSCSKEILYTNKYSFDSASILLAGNGDFNVKFFHGKFEAYQRTYVLTPFNIELCGFIFFLLKSNIDKLTKGNRGSVISFIVKSMISDFKFYMPDDYHNDLTFKYLNNLLQQISINNKELDMLYKLKDNILYLTMKH